MYWILIASDFTWTHFILRFIYTWIYFLWMTWNWLIGRYEIDEMTRRESQVGEEWAWFATAECVISNLMWFDIPVVDDIDWCLFYWEISSEILRREFPWDMVTMACSFAGSVATVLGGTLHGQWMLETKMRITLRNHDENKNDHQEKYHGIHPECRSFWWSISWNSWKRDRQEWLKSWFDRQVIAGIHSHWIW